MKKNIGILLALLCAALLVQGCVSATAMRVGRDGTSESIRVTGFLEHISNGTYTNGSGVSLSVSDATPDQQSIATLSAGVVELGKTAMLLAKQPTNSVPIGTNLTIRAP